MRKLLLSGVLLSISISFAGDIYAQGTKFGELIKISYKGEGKDKVLEGYLELPSGKIWKFNTLKTAALRNLAAFVKIDYVQPSKDEPAFKEATTPYNAVKFEPIKKFRLVRIYTLPVDKVKKFIEEGYNYSRGFRCGRVEDISIKEFKTGWFSHKKATKRRCKCP